MLAAACIFNDFGVQSLCQESPGSSPASQNLFIHSEEPILGNATNPVHAPRESLGIFLITPWLIIIKIINDSFCIGVHLEWCRGCKMIG